ncbi:hypothetical protein ACJMK2_015606, partial [Sinanodonta woodiana]
LTVNIVITQRRANTASMAFQLYPPKKFRPVSRQWQIEKSKDLHLNVQFYLKYGREKLFTQTSPPKQTASVQADGNCFFRALSYVITGVEDYHMNIREAITMCVEKNSGMFRTLLQSRGGMHNYVCSMRQPREWATDTEIFAAATLLKTVIEVCTPCRTKRGLEYQWQTFTPLDKPELRGPSIYISNRDSHFEPVLDVEERKHNND